MDPETPPAPEKAAEVSITQPATYEEAVALIDSSMGEANGKPKQVLEAIKGFFEKRISKALTREQADDKASEATLGTMRGLAKGRFRPEGKPAEFKPSEGLLGKGPA